MKNANDSLRYLTETELAQRWRVNRRTLRNWRSLGKGPSFAKFGGAVRYPLHLITEIESQSEKECWQ